jgi:hypothetical protein
MQKLQDVLAPRYTLKVHPQEVRRPLLFRGKDFKDGKYIHVYHHDEHFDAITSITAFLSYSYYCEKFTMAITIESNTSIAYRNVRDV